GDERVEGERLEDVRAHRGVVALMVGHEPHLKVVAHVGDAADPPRVLCRLALLPEGPDRAAESHGAVVRRDRDRAAVELRVPVELLGDRGHQIVVRHGLRLLSLWVAACLGSTVQRSARSRHRRRLGLVAERAWEWPRRRGRSSRYLFCTYYHRGIDLR